MKISWVVAHNFTWPEGTSIEQIKKVGSIWSSWRAWRDCRSDNVICDDLGHARRFLKRALQAVCNLWLPRRYYSELERPHGVKWYDGEYHQQTISVEDVIAMHLCAQNSDIVLLAGFDLGVITSTNDVIQDHIMRNQLGLTRQVMIDNPEVQWVVLDHERNLDTAFATLQNVNKDSLSNVLLLCPK